MKNKKALTYRATRLCVWRVLLLLGLLLRARIWLILLLSGLFWP